MSTIATTADGLWYVVTFFPDAIEDEVVNNDDLGWRATLGMLNGERVPVKVYYRQDRYTLDQVKTYAEKLRECPICNGIDKNAGKVESINVANNYLLKNQEPKAQATSTRSSNSIGNMFVDTLMNAMVDSMLTPTGKFFIATLLDDERLLTAALPKNDVEAINIMADFLSADTPKDMIFKSPKEMKKYARALRAGTKTEDEDDEEKPVPTYKHKRSVIIS